MTLALSGGVAAQVSGNFYLDKSILAPGDPVFLHFRSQLNSIGQSYGQEPLNHAVQVAPAPLAVKVHSSIYHHSNVSALFEELHDFLSLAHVVGTRFHGKAEARGNRGTTLDMEFYQSATAEPNVNAHSVNSIKGVAKDNNNIYKLIFD